MASFWKLLLFGLISEPLWRARGLRTKVGACSNKSNFVPNEEVRIGPFRFSSLKSPFKCILVCVIWSGESRALGVGGHDDLASFSCSSQSWCHVSVQPSPHRDPVWPPESLCLLSLPGGTTLGTFPWVNLQKKEYKNIPKKSIDRVFLARLRQSEAS